MVTRRVLRRLLQGAMALVLVPLLTVASGAGTQCLAAQSSHHLLPGDVLEVKVYRQDDLDMTLRVGEDGTIRYPMCGRIKVQGQSVGFVENAIIAGLKKARFEDPQVVVRVTEFTPRRVYVVGEIEGGKGELTNALEIPPGGRLTLLQAISGVGGFKEGAAADRVVVLRRDNTGNRKSITVNARKIMNTGQGDLDMELQPDDLILVPQQDQVFVYGRVNKPGAFFVPPGGVLTLSRALALAGGSERPSSEGMLTIIRGDKVLHADLFKMVDDGETAADIQLQPGDVVYVPQSRW